MVARLRVVHDGSRDCDARTFNAKSEVRQLSVTGELVAGNVVVFVTKSGDVADARVVGCGDVVGQQKQRSTCISDANDTLVNPVAADAVAGRRPAPVATGGVDGRVSDVTLILVGINVAKVISASWEYKC